MAYILTQKGRAALRVIERANLDPSEAEKLLDILYGKQ